MRKLIALLGVTMAFLPGRAAVGGDGHLACLHGCLDGACAHIAKMKDHCGEMKKAMQGKHAEKKQALAGALADHKAKKKPCPRAGQGAACPGGCDAGCTPVAASWVGASPQGASWSATATPAAPSYATAQSYLAGAPCNGPCYPPGDGRPCLPPYVAPQWITPPCPTPALAQGQLAGSSAQAGVIGCPPTPPACCGSPSFYCPPMILPATPAAKLVMGGRVALMPATRYGQGASSQIDDLR